MDHRLAQLKKRLGKQANKGFRGYPVATFAFYGPDDQRASKLAVGIVPGEDEEVSELGRWFDDVGDVRNSVEITEEVVEFLKRHGVLSVVATDRVIGCPHEEGIDYEGEYCPECPFWINRDRWSGETIQ